MRVTLAYPLDGHQPDETIDVDGKVGRQLVRDGRARLPGPDLDGVTHDQIDGTVAELRRYADARGIDLTGAHRKSEILTAIRNYRAAQRASQTPVTPVDGVNPEEATDGR